jgi:hypothetical protein
VKDFDTGKLLADESRILRTGDRDDGDSKGAGLLYDP